MSNWCPGRIGPGSECPRCRPAVPGTSRLGPKALGVDQLSRATPAQLRNPVGSTSCSRPLAVGSEGPRGRPALPGQSHSVLRAHGSTSCPPRHGPGSEEPRGRPAFLGDMGPCQRACGVDQPSRASQARARGPVMFTSTPGGFGLCPRAWLWNSCPGRLAQVSEGPRGNQRSRATQSRARGPAVSTNSPGRFGCRSEVPRSTSCPG